jgi:IMP dehydrogenase
VVSPTSAAQLSALGGLTVLNLEGLWTRYADPTAAFAEIAAANSNTISSVLQKVYAQPIDPELIVARIKEMRAAGIVTAASLSPKLTQKYWQQVVAAGVDLFVIRGATVSAEHVSNGDDPLNLKAFNARWCSWCVGGIWRRL